MTTPMSLRFFSLALLTAFLSACATTGQEFETDPNLFEEELLTFSELLDEGDAALANGNLDSAQVNYAIAVEQEPDNVEALYKLGFVHYQKSSYEVSERVLRHALQTDPEHQASMQTMAMLLLQLERPEEAESYLDRLIEINPNSWEALSTLGALRDIQGRHLEAQALFQDAVRLEPRSSKLQNNLGYSFYLAGDYRSAEDHFRRALQYNRNYERAWANLALIYNRQGRDQEAAAAFNQIVSESQTANNLGYLGLLSGDDVAARKQFNRAISLSSSYYDRAFRNLDSLNDPNRNRGANGLTPQTKATSDKNKPVDKVNILASGASSNSQTVAVGTATQSASNTKARKD